MKTQHASQFQKFSILLLLMLCFNPFKVPLSASEPQDKTLSPYLKVMDNGDGEIPIIPLLHTEAEVNIAGVIANVKVTQIYHNEGNSAIEAIYVFPGSIRAAVHSMTMKIGERTIVAQISEKEKARQQYDQAKNEGKTASLLEQHRPNVFQMNVANVMPGDSLVINMTYTELLVPTDGLYEFVYPTVVGPRYSDDPGPAFASASSEPWAENPYTSEGTAPQYTFNIKATINAGIPIKKALCKTHDMSIRFNGPSAALLDLKDSEKLGGNRDVIINYGLRGEKVESGLLLFEGKEENFFLAMMEPPLRVTPDQIPAREYIFIVDVSGSMNGFPLDVSKNLMKELLAGLRAEDSFNVLLFASANSVLSEASLPATQANINKAMDLIDRQRGGGGTQLLPALNRALNMPHEAGVSRSFIIATDGYVTVEKEAFDLIRNNLGEANFFTFGIGSSVNRHLLEGMAKVGKGEPFVLTTAAQAKKEAQRFKTYISAPVLTDIEFVANGMKIYDVEPLSVPDVFADRPVIVFGKYQKGDYGQLRISGQSGHGKFSKTFEAADALASSNNNEALKFLWARKRIELLDDYRQVSGAQDSQEEVTALGLKYGLLTAYTSFVAIDQETRNPAGNATTVSQPLPLPEGVSDHAVGGQRTRHTMGGLRKYKSFDSSANYSEVPMIAEEAESTADFDRSSRKVDSIVSQKEKFVENDKVNDPMIYERSMVEIEPTFIGGKTAMMKFFAENVSESVRGLSGTIYIEFIVTEEGKIIQVSGREPYQLKLLAEALRLVKAMPDWSPGKMAGKPVATRMVIPIKF